jgi:hypothetical protein
MEVLTALISKAAQASLLMPIGRCTPIQRISIFADNVILFSKPTVLDLISVREILGLFGEASGLQVKYSKSTTILIRGGQMEGRMVRWLLECTVSDFPAKYLGLQLSLKPLTRTQWRPILVQAMRIMPNWQRSLITRTGRLTLVKAVLSARQIHMFTVVDPPG